MPLILAVDTSAKPVSCALVENNKVLGCFYSNTGLTHSQTLMPMIDALLKVSDISIDRLDAVAVNAGPGSFTGVRIGVSAVKGIAFTYNTPCISVSTLEAMAEAVACSSDSIICGVMDARCQQVYSALFQRDEQGQLVRLTADEAISIDALREQLKTYDSNIVLVGDGSELCYRTLSDDISRLSLAPSSVRYQSASATAVVAHRKFEAGETVDAESLLPVYLRLPQAERELNSRLNNK